MAAQRSLLPFAAAVHLGWPLGYPIRGLVYYPNAVLKVNPVISPMETRPAFLEATGAKLFGADVLFRSACNGDGYMSNRVACFNSVNTGWGDIPKQS